MGLNDKWLFNYHITISNLNQCIESGKLKTVLLNWPKNVFSLSERTEHCYDIILIFNTTEQLTN